jgi:hypothetical protein
MELNVKFVTRPGLGTKTRMLVVIIVIIAVLVIWVAGYGPATSIPVVLAAGFAAIQLADAVAGDPRKLRSAVGWAAPDSGGEPLLCPGSGFSGRSRSRYEISGGTSVRRSGAVSWPCCWQMSARLYLPMLLSARCGDTRTPLTSR